MKASVLFQGNVLLILIFLALADIQDIMADSPEAPLMSKEQIEACQQGHMNVLSSYLGKNNTVIMACTYKAKWEPPVSQTGKGILTTYAIIVRSEDQQFPVGTKVKWINLIEEVSAIPQKVINRWKEPEGELVYIINPLERLKEKQDISGPEDNTIELFSSIQFPISNQSFYNNLRAVLDIPVPSASSSTPSPRRKKSIMP